MLTVKTRCRALSTHHPQIAVRLGLLLILTVFCADTMAGDNPIGTWEGTLDSDNCLSGILTDWQFHADGSTNGGWTMYCSNLGQGTISSNNAEGTYTYSSGVLTASYTGIASETNYGTSSSYTLTLTNGAITCDTANGTYSITFHSTLWQDYGLGYDAGLWHVTRISTPFPATAPSPADGAEEQSIDVDLSWSNGGGACTFDVYLGTTNPPTELICPAADELTCDPGTLLYATTYFWKVDSENTNGTTPGAVWQFTTQPCECDGLVSLISYWLEITCDSSNYWCGGCDFDLSTTVDMADFAVLASHWLEDSKR